MDGPPDSNTHLTWSNVGLGFSFVIFDAVVSRVFGLGVGVPLLTAAVRCVVQLAIMALVLQKIFEAENPWGVAGLAFLLNLLGTIEVVVNKAKMRFHNIFPIVLGSMLCSTIPVSILGARFAMSIEPFWKPDQYIPIVGMLCGATISGVVIALNFVLKEIYENRDKIETYLAFGASRLEACQPVAKEALRLALTPPINQMSYYRDGPASWLLRISVLPYLSRCSSSLDALSPLVPGKEGATVLRRGSAIQMLSGFWLVAEVSELTLLHISADVPKSKHRLFEKGIDAPQMRDEPLVIRCFVNFTSLLVLGIIAIPGMMTGAILGGAPVQQAARLQMVIMFMIAASSALAAILVTVAALAIVVDSEHRIRVNRVDPRKHWVWRTRERATSWCVVKVKEGLDKMKCTFGLKKSDDGDSIERNGLLGD
ncbi:UPF0014-domain-containing protein [Sanghuangporus baumii]|uniref:UPF0014-domain-containing protein n=1 Tax=Sanghuangporus baumii TaxID=108892 RepID=A0A9Q5I5B3_SANBA|nr:UPF0014-domain-containing protein [Sanghuangporus baumii]